MTVQTKDYLKGRFAAGNTPTQADWIDLVDSYLDTNEDNFPDPLPAVDGSRLTNVIGWTAPETEPSYVSANALSVSGDQRSVYPVGMDLRFILASGTVYSTVKSVAYDGGSDTTSIGLINSLLDSTLSSVRHRSIEPYPNEDSGKVSSLVRLSSPQSFSDPHSFQVVSPLSVIATIDRDPLSLLKADNTGFVISEEVASVYSSIKAVAHLAVTLTSAPEDILCQLVFNSNTGGSFSYEFQNMNHVDALLSPRIEVSTPRLPIVANDEISLQLRADSSYTLATATISLELFK